LENRFVNPHNWLGAAKWATVCWIVLFWKLGAPALMDPDEAHYAQVTREMLRADNWMIPLLDGLPYIDKPVLFHWLQRLAIAMLGETETAMRLPSAIAAVALFWTTRWIGEQLFDERIGVRGWLMLATLPLTFLLGSIGVFDMVFTALLFGAVAFALVAALRNRPRLQYASYVLLSLAVMTKGPVALVLAGAFFLVGLASGRETRTALLSLRWVTGAVLSVLLSLPWFVWMYYALGWHFVHQYVLAGNLYYVTQPQSFSNRAFNHTLYISTFLAGFFPWSIVPPMARAYQDSPRGNSSVGLGRRGVHLLQHRALQGRSLRVSRGTRVLPARRAGVDERQRLAARSRRRARQHLRALVRCHARRHSRSCGGHFRIVAVRSRARPAAGRAADSAQSGRGWCGPRGDHPSAQNRLAGRVWRSGRDAARDLRLRAGDWAAGTGARTPD
jgi:hypothetical protein